MKTKLNLNSFSLLFSEKVKNSKWMKRNEILTSICVIVVCMMFAGTSNAQVTIGSELIPAGGALLDLKENDGTVTTTKGFLYPRVALSAKDELYPMYQSTDQNYIDNKASLKLSHTGLTVFNTANGSLYTPGLYYWDGTQWRRFDDSPVAAAGITELFCGSATLTPSKYASGAIYEGVLTVPYSGGTGGFYTDGSVISIGNGLSAQLNGGKLVVGSGELVYRVWGTTTNSSANPISAPISFDGKNCDVALSDASSAVNLRNLTANTIISQSFSDNNGTDAITLNFGTVKITESGSYAFSMRLYGLIGPGGSGADNLGGRYPYYIYLHKKPHTTATNLVDAAEIDIVTVKQGPSYQDYSYGVTLGGHFEAGDEVEISMHRGGASGSAGNLYNWTLKQGASNTSPIRTSLIFWKL